MTTPKEHAEVLRQIAEPHLECAVNDCELTFALEGHSFVSGAVAEKAVPAFTAGALALEVLPQCVEAIADALAYLPKPEPGDNGDLRRLRARLSDALAFGRGAVPRCRRGGGARGRGPRSAAGGGSMTRLSEAELERIDAGAKALPQTWERKPLGDRRYECPLCEQEGTVEAVALDATPPHGAYLMAYGIGDDLRAAEAFAATAVPDTLALCVEIRALRAERDAAVAAERERCARLAETIAQQARLWGDSEAVWRSAGETIAAAIRAGKEGT